MQHNTVPVEESFSAFQLAQASGTGLARHSRFVMSHVTGKVQVLGLTRKHIVMSYHRAVRAADYGRLLICPRNPNAYWLDDYNQRDANCFGDVPEDDLVETDCAVTASEHQRKTDPV